MLRSYTVYSQYQLWIFTGKRDNIIKEAGITAGSNFWKLQTLILQPLMSRCPHRSLLGSAILSGPDHMEQSSSVWASNTPDLFVPHQTKDLYTSALNVNTNWAQYLGTVNKCSTKLAHSSTGFLTWTFQICPRFRAHFTHGNLPISFY